MADDENITDTPAAESVEPPAPDASTEEGTTEEAPKKAAAKKSIKKTAPKEKATTTSTTGEVAAAAHTADATQHAEEKLAAMGMMPGESQGKPTSPPKAFWWRALLMVAVVVILFSIIRGMVKGQQPATTAVESDTASLVSSIPEEPGSPAVDDKVVVEEAPSQPPAEAAMPAPGYYGYPYPPQQPYYPQPYQGSGAAGQPAYPMAPQGGYAYPYYPYPYYPDPYYPYPPQRPYYPSYNPWYPPYPAQRFPEQR
jgi:hypothetical protein